MPENNSTGLEEFDIAKSCFIGCEAGYDESTTVIFGAPFDGTVTFRPGSRFAPMRMRAESVGLETYSPYQDSDLEDIKICDAGDLDLPFGDTSRALSMIGGIAKYIIKAGKRPVMIGGEHLVSLPAIEAAHEKYKDLHIIHFDAHTDLRDEYLGEKLSHANVIRRAWDLLGDGHIHQFGIRSGTREEFEWAESGHTNLHRYNVSKVEKTAEELRGAPVYVTIDLDVLDPSIFPGTGTPEAGGVTFSELLGALLALRNLNIVAADVVELSPHYDMSGVSTAVACKVLRELLLIIGK
ncbi:MAG TPA: agmatinase [Ruminiclostridium sp.]|nr:agmatinase [Ruminiclostridium sp.]